MQNTDMALNSIHSDAEKAYVVVDHVLANYFDNATRPIEAIRYDFVRIRTLLEISLDYLRSIQYGSTEKGEEMDE